MKKIFLLMSLCFLLSRLTLSAADMTWVGKISDSMCGASHTKMEHGGQKVNDVDCTKACLKEGAKYVFVTKGQVHEISNQDFSALPDHAGHTVKLTGEMGKDGKITVSKIEMPMHKTHTTSGS